MQISQWCDIDHFGPVLHERGGRRGKDWVSSHSLLKSSTTFDFSEPKPGSPDRRAR